MGGEYCEATELIMISLPDDADDSGAALMPPVCVDENQRALRYFIEAGDSIRIGRSLQAARH